MEIPTTHKNERPATWRRIGLLTLGFLAAGSLLQAQYCEAGGTNPSYFIKDVTTTGGYTNINNVNSGFSPNGYGDFTGMFLTAEEGMSINFTVVFETGTQGVNIWVDWNNDLDFDDPGEKIWSAGAYISSPATGTLVIPTGTPEGIYRMRVRNHWLSTDPDPCGIITYGEVEDYTLVIGDAPSCFPPTDLAANNVTTSGASFSWTASQTGSAGSYQWEVRSSGTAGSGAAGLVDGGTTATTTASTGLLEPNTTYALYVRADCGPDDGESFWVGPKSFRTLCVALDIPYLEDFNDVAVPNLPFCMSMETVEGNPWKTGTAPTGMTGNAAMVSYTPNGSPDMESWLFSAGLNLVGGTSYRLTYKFFNNSTFYTERLASAYGTTASAAGMTSYLRYHDVVQGTTVLVDTIEFTPPATGVYYIGFICYSESNQLNIYLDDIRVMLSPTCEGVPEISLVETFADGVDFSWTASATGPANGYDWEVRADGNAGDPNPAASGSVGAGITSASATGLDPNTEYTVHVRANCGGGDMSNWAEDPLVFRTLCLSTTIPYLEDFESVTVPEIPNCMFGETISGNPWTTVETPLTQGFTGKTARVSYTPSGSPEMNSWLFTQGLELTGGTAYRLSYKYANYLTSYSEAMAVAYGAGANAASMTNALADHPSINNNAVNTNVVEFTPVADGVYYIGFKCYSGPNEYYLYLDDISVILLDNCSGTPNPGATTGPGSICAGIPFTVGFENDPGQIGGYTYQWETSSDGSNWANAPGNSTETTYATSQTAETWYRVRMTCSGDLNATSAPLHVTMTPATACYCSSNFTSVDYEHITHVSFAGIDNTSSGIVGGPVDYTDQVAQVQAGATFPMSVTITADFSEYVYAFIDWNQNGILNDVGEVYTLAANVEEPGPYTLNIAVPADAALGTTRMRVMLAWNGSTPDPCASLSYGEAEDYSVNVAELVDCEGVTGGPALPGTPCVTAAGQDGLWNDDCVCVEGMGVEGSAAKEAFSLHPNPASTELFITTPNGQPAQVRVFDMLGQLVLEKDQATRLNVAHLAPGTYSLMIMDGKGNPQARARFVKQ